MVVKPGRWKGLWYVCCRAWSSTENTVINLYITHML